MVLVAKVARLIDNITFDQNIGWSPRRIQNYVVNCLTERFVDVEISLTILKRARARFFKPQRYTKP